MISPESGPGTQALVGRRREVEVLDAAVRAVVAGRGQIIMIEGEAGIGKSTLLALTATLADAAGCQVFHAAADRLTTRFPLHVLAAAIGMSGRLDGDSRVPSGTPSWTVDDPLSVVSEQILSRIDQLCSAAPTVLVVDDVQWVDEASQQVLSRVVAATSQIPLLVVAAARLGQLAPELAWVRNRITPEYGSVLSLESLTETESAELTAAIVQATAGPGLTARVAAAGGNPFYVRETVDALLRAGTVTIANGTADVDPTSTAETVTLTGAIADRLGSLTAPTQEVLRLASLLGHQLVVTDLAALAGRTPLDLMPMLDEALARAIFAESGDRLTFRHGLIRDALYESMPQAVRTALHRQAAQALDAVGAPPERVAEHLMATSSNADTFTVAWFVEHGERLANQAPAVTEEMLTKVLDGPLPDESARADLEYALLTAAFRQHSYVVVESTATRLLKREIAPEKAAAVAWMLGYTLTHIGRAEEGLATAEAAAARAPLGWESRLESLAALALFMLGRNSEASGRAEGVLRVDRENPDPFAVGYARHVLSIVASREGRVEQALALIDGALAALGDDPYQVDLRILMLMNRTYRTERMSEADASLRAARTLSERHGGVRASHLALAAATHFFQVGRWDDALSELDERNVITHEPPERRHLRLGLSALITARRGQLDAARTFLAQVDDDSDSENTSINFTYVRLARSAVAEQLGDLAGTIAILAAMIDPDDAILAYFRHKWVARVVRVALSVGDTDLARRAAATAASDARTDLNGMRAVAARWCAALLTNDVAVLDGCTDFYRADGLVTLLADVSSDAAVACATRGNLRGARSRMAQAAAIYRDLNVEFAVHRSEAQLRALGLRRGVSARRAAPTTGWDALTKSEVRIAELVADGRSNPDIAAALFLSRRTVESHVSHILTKLAVRSRIEVARAVDRHRSSKT